MAQSLNGKHHVERRGTKKGTKLGTKHGGLVKVIKVPAGASSITEQYAPTDENRELVSILTINGVPQLKIAELLSMSFASLKKHFGKELTHALAQKNSEVAASLFKQAKEGNVTAQIFWLKSRARWRENDPVPPPPPNSLQYDTSKLSETELRALLNLLQKARAEQVVEVPVTD